MLIVRDAQLAALGRVFRERFLAAMVCHLRTHFADEVRDIDDAELRDRVQRALEKARGYGLVAQRHVARLLNIFVVFGWESDQDQKTPWIRQYLVDPSVTDPGARLDRLVKAASARLAAEEEEARLLRKFDLA